MPIKATNLNNTFKGSRKLSKTSKKNSKKVKTSKKNKNNSSEEMRDLLNSDDNKYMGNQMPNQMQNQMQNQMPNQMPNYMGNQMPNQMQNYMGNQMQNQINQNDIDPLMISNFIPHENNQNQNLNKIGNLLGAVAQVNSNMQQIGNNISNFDSTIQQNLQPQYNPLAQQLMTQQNQMPMSMGNQMPMGNMYQMPMGQQNMQSFMGKQPTEGTINIKNLSNLYKVPKII